MSKSQTAGRVIFVAIQFRHDFIQNNYSGKRIKSNSWSFDIAAVGLNTVVFLR